jgi:acyl carrier protein
VALKTESSIVGQKITNIDMIRAQIKEAIQRVSGIAVEAISDTASYETDLGLDSLSILEIAVELENQFKFHASEEELSSIRTVEDAVNLVKKRLDEAVA